MTEPLRTTFAARPGGVSTLEVGTITGDLELESSLKDGRCRHRLRYAGAGEWYRVDGDDGGPVDDAAGLERAHEALVGSLRAVDGEDREPTDPPHGSQQGRDAQDPAAGSFGGARRG